MKTNEYHAQIIQFIVMLIVGMFLNPMNVLVYNISDLYFSLTLFYGGLFMASNMMWAHQIVHYLTIGHFNANIFLVGVVLSILVTFGLLRNQLLIDDKQWLRRMISHHSTALTTSYKIYNSTKNKKVKKLAKEIIDSQTKEIRLMKSMV